VNQPEHQAGRRRHRFRLHIEGRTARAEQTRTLDQVNESIAEVLSESTATPRLAFRF
jgi:hypothetical protein